MLPSRSISISIALAVTLALSACAIQPKQPAALPLLPGAMVGTQWIAVAIGGIVPVVQPRPTLRWTGMEQVAGNGGCNGFVGRATMDGAHGVRFSALAGTGKPCMSSPTGQEDLFFKALEQTRSAHLVSGDLVLMDQGGLELARLIQTNSRQ